MSPVASITKIELMPGEEPVGDGIVASVAERVQSAPANMIWIPCGTFRMGSDKHYPEEAPAHQVTVSGFWMDEYAVTNTGSHALSRQQVAERSPNAHLIGAHIPTPTRSCSHPHNRTASATARVD